MAEGDGGGKGSGRFGEERRNRTKKKSTAHLLGQPRGEGGGWRVVVVVVGGIGGVHT